MLLKTSPMYAPDRAIAIADWDLFSVGLARIFGGSLLRLCGRIRTLPCESVSETPTPQQIAGRASAARALLANAVRDARIADLRSQGLTLQAIGKKVGLTHQRVRAILLRMKVERAA